MDARRDKTTTTKNSDAEGRKRKRNSTNPNAKTYTNSRCGLLSFKRFLESLSEQKCNLVKDLGLGSLLGLKVQQHRNKQIEELMRRFDPQTRKLAIHGRDLVITEDDVGRILGLPAGTKDISKVKGNLRELREKYNLKKEKRKQLIVSMRNIDNNEEWQANFILLAIHCVLRPTSSLYCSPTSLDFLDDVSGLRDVNWCKYVLDGLLAGAADFHEQVKNVEAGKSLSLRLKGCTILLEIFYMEHVKCNFMNIPWGLRLLPRISDWTDQLVKKVYAIVNGKLDDHSVELFLREANNPPIQMDVDDAGPSNVSRGVGEEVSRSNLLARVEALEATVATLVEEVSSIRGMLEKNLAANDAKSKVEEKRSEKMQPINERSPLAKENDEVEPATAQIVREIEKDRELCPICLTDPKDMAFGCGHQTCCACGQDLQSCPICRSTINTRIKLY